MQDHQLPPYLDSTGAFPIPGPYQHDDSHIYTFFLNGCLQKIQHQLDISLNQVSPEQGRFVAATSLVMLQFAKLKAVYSLIPGYRERGKMVETEVITWVLVAELDDTNKIKGSYWHPLYLWVDNATALTIGREVYGYPKRLAQTQMPNTFSAPFDFSLDVHEYENFGADNFAQYSQLITIKPAEKTEFEQSAFKKANMANSTMANSTLTKIAAQFAKTMLTHGDNTDLPISQLLPTFIDDNINQLFLKQFPDTTGKKAVYQGIVTTSAKYNNIYAIQSLPHDKLEVLINSHDTTPLNDVLGLKLGSNKVLMAFYMNVDFTTDCGKEIRRHQGVSKQKIAVIGGGIGSIASVFELTEQPNWQHKYDITLYQMGWRLGGKGASGRNAQHHQRIEEHGLHIWFGCYHNAFNMMNRAYQAIKRDRSHPHQCMEDAFEPRATIALTESINGQTQVTDVNYPVKAGKLGHGSHVISARQSLVATLELLNHALHEHMSIENSATMKVMSKTKDVVQNALNMLSPNIKTPLPAFMPDIQGPIKGLRQVIDNLVKNSRLQNDPLAKIQLNALKPILIAIRRLVLSDASKVG